MQLEKLGIKWMIKIGICDISKVLYTIKKNWCTLMEAKEKSIKVWSYLPYVIFI
jgi:hypothetical protein